MNKTPGFFDLFEGIEEKPKSLKPKTERKTKTLDMSDPCEKCELKRTKVGSKRCSEKNPVMFVGMYPGKKEVENLLPFQGDSGDYFHAVLEDKGFNIGKEVYEANVFKCRPAWDNAVRKYIYPTPAQVKACGKLLLREIREVEPRLIVLMGDTPLKFFFNKPSVTVMRGRILIKGDYKFLITYNPAHIIRNEANMADRDNFEKDILTAFEVSHGIERPVSQDYKLVTTYEELDMVVNFLEQEEILSIDFETYAPGKWEDKKALDPYAEGFKMVSVSFSSVPNTGFCILLEHPENPLNFDTVLSKIKPLLESNIPKIGQSIKFDFKVSGAHFGIYIENIVFDTMLASVLLDDRKGIHNLDRLSMDYLGERSYKHEMGKIGSVISSPEELRVRNCSDSDFVLRLYPILKKKLEDAGMYDYYMQILDPSISALGRVEIRGIPVIRAKVDEVIIKYEKMAEELLNKLKAYPEVQQIPDFSVRSSDDLQELLFDKFKFPPQKDTKTGYSTNKGTIEILTKKIGHPILQLIKEHKEVLTLLGTYLYPLIIKKCHIKHDGRVHPTFNQHVAVSGRLTAVRPNVQNIPVRSEHSKDILSCYGYPSEEEVWHFELFDYSQIELRILAQICQDSRMLEAFRNGEDLHQVVSHELTKLSGRKIERKYGKSLNFGIVYGMTGFGLAERLGLLDKDGNVDKKAGDQFLDYYFSVFPGVKEYQEKQKAQLKQFGYITTLWGRKRWIRSRSDEDEEAQRKAINGPIQGTATDINTLALCEIVKIFIKEGYKSFPISTIHDALLFEMHRDESSLIELITYVMENLDLPFLTSVRLKVDRKFGKNMMECKEED
jgi:DNA polymerase-1